MAKLKTLKDWASRDNADKRAALKSILEDPIFQEAVTVLKREYEPSAKATLLPPSLELTGVERLTWDSVARSGFFGFFNALENMAYIEEFTPAEPLDSWGKLLPETGPKPKGTTLRKRSRTE